MTIKDKVSVVIPSRNERFLSKTILDILAQFEGDYEIIAVLDEKWPEEYKNDIYETPAIIDDPRVVYLHNGHPYGMRDAINRAVALSTGEYILKLDGHCMVNKGMDTTLKKDIEDNWIVIPRRKRLDVELWEVQEVGKPDVDYEYLSSPSDKGVKGNIWTDRIVERLNKPEYDIDEDMTFQGSCWFTTRKHFDFLGGLSNEGYGTFVREAQEIGLKTWLSGGKVMINKKTWYAHLHKGPKYGRGYFLNKIEMEEGNRFCDDFWFNNRWEDAKYDLAWLIERFWPVPTWTPELIEQVRKK